MSHHAFAVPAFPARNKCTEHLHQDLKAVSLTPYLILYPHPSLDSQAPGVALDGPLLIPNNQPHTVPFPLIPFITRICPLSWSTGPPPPGSCWSVGPLLFLQWDYSPCGGICVCYSHHQASPCRNASYGSLSFSKKVHTAQPESRLVKRWPQFRLAGFSALLVHRSRSFELQPCPTTCLLELWPCSTSSRFGFSVVSSAPASAGEFLLLLQGGSDAASFTKPSLTPP